MTDAPSVSVIVLSYNRPEYLAEALTSVAAQTHRPAEVFVVDNRSPRSDEVAQVAGRFPGFRLILNPDNRGFTGGMNTGLLAATSKYVLFTEDDIVLSPGAVAAVVRHLEAEPAVGLAGAVMLNRTAGTVRCAGGEVQLGPRFVLRVIGQGQAPPGPTAPYSVSYLPGAFILGHRELLARVGGFWDDLFMYQEDVDFCLRIAGTGARIDVVPAALVWHFDPPAHTDPGWLTDLKVRNLLWLYVRHAPVGVLLAFTTRYYGFGLFRALAADRQRAWAIARAVAVTVFRLPRLLSLRWSRTPLP